MCTTSTTVTTVGDGGKLKGSIKLDDATGLNCAMAKDEYIAFAILVLGLRPLSRSPTQYQTEQMHLP